MVAYSISYRRRVCSVDAAVPKEPRVLSGRSLQCLARHISGAGIKLAMQLDLPDSTITGMAFDTLANGHTAADVTYRMLLLWKRRVTYYHNSVVGDSTSVGNEHVDMLVQAIKVVTGNTQVADVIVEFHRANRELTPNCFIIREYSRQNVHPSPTEW